MEKFIRDPIDYLETAINNADKMSDTRKIKIATKSAVIGFGTGVCAFTLSIISGNSNSTSGLFSILMGLSATGVSCIYRAHEFGIVDQTLDSLRETRVVLKNKIKVFLE